MVDSPGADVALVELRARMHRAYDDCVDSDEIERAIVECSRRLREARITTYVPVLIEKQVRDRLRSHRPAPSR